MKKSPTKEGSRFKPFNRPIVLSVVMPVYNEASTVEQAITAVLDFDLSPHRLELVIIESNSTDRTREIVQKFADDVRVKLILQEEARGKGAAVREGFQQCTGDIILIQDGDLEYDVADYPKLLAPILSGETAFVLGSRHEEGRPLRLMPDARLISKIVNAGHHVFLMMFNITYGTKLRDPFTMYKVFRRKCIENVEFVANRFDFDFELVAKLMRLGYMPIEVPVYYSARSFAAGKKVRFFRDPLTWIVACVRFRFSPLNDNAHR